MTTFQANPLIVPAGTLKAWQGPNALKFRSCVAAEFDALVLQAELVGDARSPLKCDATVLPRHAHDRNVVRYSSETESSHRQCLAKWKQIHRSRGKAYGILRRLRIMLLPYGRPMLRYVHTNGSGTMTEWFTLLPGDETGDAIYFDNTRTDPEFSRQLVKPANWLWDPQASAGQWSRYWVLIYTSGLTDPAGSIEWDVSGEWDDGVSFWDFGLPSPIIADCLSLCKDMQACGSSCFGIFQVHDDTAFDPSGSGVGYPDGTWQYAVDPTTGAPIRRTGVTYSYVRMAV
jgi:hypothetical protein